MQTVLILILGLGVWEGAADLSKYSQEYDDYDAEDNDVSYDTFDDGRGQANDALDNPKEPFKPSGGIDFTGCTVDPSSGMCCVLKEEQMTTLEKDPILECTHKNTEQCHYTYVTQFKPSQEEVCEENFEKTCSITFTKRAQNETVQKCYTPLVKVCGGQGAGGQGANSVPGSLDQYGDSRRQRRRHKKDTQGQEQCRVYYESSCTTRYVEKRPGKFVGDTACEKLPVEFCGKGKFWLSFWL